MIERVARATAIQIDGVKLLGVRLNVATNIATNTGFEPIIGVIRLASPLLKTGNRAFVRGKKGIPAKIRKGQTLRKGYSWTRMGRVGSKPTLADWNRQEILVYRNQVQAPFYKARHCMHKENPRITLECMR